MNQADHPFTRRVRQAVRAIEALGPLVTRRRPILSALSKLLPAILVTVALSPLLRTSVVVDGDDKRLILPLAEIHTLGDYFGMVRSNRSIDVQPVRDLTYWIDYRLQELTGFWSFHITNWLLWLFIVYLAAAMLLDTSTLLNKVLLLLFSIHPMLISSAGWLAGRKQLLSCLFILLATSVVVRGHARLREKGLIVSCYALSIFSHPITLLWPVWFAIYRHTRDRGREYGLQIVLAAVAICCGLANYRYYTQVTVEQNLQPKIIASNLEHLGLVFLSLGRGIFNLLLPCRIAMFYYPGHVENVVGLLLLVVLLWLFFKFAERRDLLVWLSFSIVTIVPALAQISVAFWLDTYMISASFGALILSTTILRRVRDSAGLRVVATFACLLLLIFFTAEGLAISRSRTSNDLALQRAYEKANSPRVLVLNILSDLRSDRVSRAARLTAELEVLSPNHKLLHSLKARGVLRDETRSTQQKVEAMGSLPANHPLRSYYYGYLALEAKDYARALALMRTSLQRPELASVISELGADATFACREAFGVGCEALAADLRARFGARWDESRFRTRLAMWDSGMPPPL